MHAGDTIVAISTPAGRGGIGVVRLSGPSALAAANSIFRAHSSAPLDSPNLARLGRVIDPTTGDTLDTAILTYFKAPHSYTGEDVVELSCHGSPVILGRVLEVLAASGARIAEPGEFTMRAFLNRRIDLAQAQAVRDLIDAQSRFQASLATRQMEGALSKRLAPLKDLLVEVIVQIESSVEFVEDDISIEAHQQLIEKLNSVIDGCARIADSFSFGRYVREGFDLAIVGKPNVGKSSVFNRLVGGDRAIVTDIPGTTRDALYERTSIDGVPVRLIDTAGIRETTDVVERIGIDRSRRAIADADVVLLVLDASAPLSEDDSRLLAEVSATSRIILLNKSDLPDCIVYSGGDETALPVSALTGSGFDSLIESIFRRLTGAGSIERDDVMITDSRQHAAIKRAVERLEHAIALLSGGELEEVVLLQLRGSLGAIGEVTGETLTEDILGQIFSTFCIGK